MHLKNQGFSFVLIFSILVVSVLVFCFWPLPDSVTDENANLKTAEKEAAQTATANQTDPTAITNPVVNTNANTTTSNSASGYLSALEGVNGLRDKAIAYYDRTGALPDTAALLNAPLDNQSTTSLQDSSYLDDHNLGIIGLFPVPVGTLCTNGIKIEGIYDTNGIRVIYDLVTVNLNGGWKNICKYGVEGADPASIKVTGCFNDITDKAELQKEWNALENACGARQ